jgi:lysyl endopeptidase
MKRFALRLAFAALALPAMRPAHAIVRTESELQPAKAVSAVAAVRPLAVASTVRLGEPQPAEANAGDGAGLSARAQIGFARSVTELRTAGELARRLAWKAADGERQVAAIAITSPGASALRVALRMGSVPRGTRFRFAAPGGASVEFDAADIEASVARNLYFDDDTPAAHLFWSPVLEGDTAVVEIEMPLAATAGELQVAVPLVSHLVASASQGFSAACGSAACDGDGGPGDGSAIARIIFTENGATYACNGMLVADRDPETVIPFFLTARHCIASQSAASSAQPYWPQGANACSASAGHALRAGAQGATLLHADAGSDLTLLRLQQAPPAGAAYAGWTVGNQQSASLTANQGLVKASLVSAVATLGQCSTGSATSARFEAAYNAGLYQWLGGTPQDGDGGS